MRLRFLNDFSRTLILAGFLISSVFFLSGCYYDNEVELYGPGDVVDCNTISAKYSTDVSPIMSASCATSGCHNSVTAAGGVVLETYAQVSASKTRVMERAVTQKTMPPSGPLPVEQLNKIKCWVDGGALNN